MTPLKLVYIAGPFRGATPYAVKCNIDHAEALGLKVAHLGAYPVIPHTMTAHFDKQLTDEFWLAGTLALMEKCDALILTDNWRTSSGATAERARMLELGRPVFETLDQLTVWLHAPHLYSLTQLDRLLTDDAR
jgi:nucleoside 2-deoxyribosyltransferase